ncbi:MAG: GNAT family N-acetyltransferase [Bradyrhizobium sp.]|uniref:GNAT family N-acetyltransferase n=1 Tax=Bosea sp. (in: a-proteobacteria) TaxID=1871050 RepID=UPI00239DDA6A|nr:GNAT family N-acetyltransferase [Bradyrhizobium sp.]MCP4738242.1 GNAT family N-acetyltransferase [Bosea sp. (in: a-proteobacteria)]
MAEFIRQGRADDAAFIAYTVLLAQRGPRPLGWFDFALDQAEPQVLDFLAKLAVATPRSWYHVSQFLIAEVDGRPAAALCAMPSRETRDTMRAAIEEVAISTGVSAADIFTRGAYARPCWVQGGEADWLIEHVASRPAAHGRGLVQALIAQALSAGRAAGFSRASITFVIGNVAAERCYAKAGFTFAEEKRDRGFEALTGSPGFRRFARAI